MDAGNSPKVTGKRENSEMHFIHFYLTCNNDLWCFGVLFWENAKHRQSKDRFFGVSIFEGKSMLSKYDQLKIP